MTQQTADVENVDPTQEHAGLMETTETQKHSINHSSVDHRSSTDNNLQSKSTTNNTHSHTQMSQPLFALAADVVRNDLMSARPPSPPYVHVPTIDYDPTKPAFPIMPVPSGPGHLTSDNVALITGNRPQTISSQRVKLTWQYEHRRRAQPILDFLYLGPLAVVRDHAWLRVEGITMIYAVREGIMVGRRLLSVEKTATDLGLEVGYLDIDDRQVLIRRFPAAIEIINAHMMRVKGAGKVLVVCETGNERSATLVAAYVMAMYGQQMVGAVQFVGQQRFCTNLNEGDKQLLWSYEQLLKATRMTAEARLQEHQAEKPAVISRKRRIEQTIDEDDDGDVSMDGGRFSDRAAFVPYVEK
ncbi:hypothetical protein N0V93_009905 [Gnomoniopsis smithogilvyi]|uniref:Tyrosine specific protein phosphatases domain-containing protein n=1 Tax=Gnomoniopsis smithogilvyi TaxID=1191159 RepID=A0A9W8YIU3_9PEZI|nr:hypothetical protein N0V93_009905 [Gnomoniopsis smithogilvyi]